jgi:hypothetical protein
MIKIKKLNIDSLIKEFELLDEKQSTGTLGGSYYYNSYGVFLGHVGSDSDVRFVTQQEWEIADCYKINGQGVLFSDTSASPYAKETLLRSFLPASAQGVYIGPGGQNILEEAIAGFVTGLTPTTFAYDTLRRRL